MLATRKTAKHAEYVKLVVLLVKPLKWEWQKNYSSQLVLKGLLLVLATRKMVKHADYRRLSDYSELLATSELFLV